MMVEAPRLSTLSPAFAKARFSLVREMAQKAFSGFPHRRIENWKYTDLARLWAAKTFTPSKNRVSLDAPITAAPNGRRIVFINGEFAPEHSDIEALPPGLSITPIDSLDPQFLEQKIKTIKAQDHPMALMNLALLGDGVVVKVAAKTAIREPLHFIYIAHNQEPDHLHALCNVIILEKDSALTIIEEVRSTHESAPTLINTLSFLDIQENANCQHYLIQSPTEKLSHIAAVHVNQAQNSHVFSFCASLGCALSRYDLEVKLNGEGAQCVLDGTFILSNKAHADIHTRVDHLASYTKSDQLYKGVVDKAARGIFNGKAVAHRGTKGILAHQINHNLLLSKTAEVNTKPDLEIYTDDVACSHGATVGQLDENALFYLQSRGISRAAAQFLLTQAFTTECLARIKDPDLHTWIAQQVTARMGQHE